VSGCSKKPEREAVPESPDTLTDNRDGQKYRTVKIGNRTWMAKNLNYEPDTGESQCYSNHYSYCKKYGRLYDWKTAKTVCPEGWHLPSRAEWDGLGQAAGGERRVNSEEGMINWDGAGKKLKAKSGWNGYNGESGNGTDDCGFSALPGGSELYKAGLGDSNAFGIAEYWGGWWTATEYDVNTFYRPGYYEGKFFIRRYALDDTDHAYSRHMNYRYDGMYEFENYRTLGLSVRCVRDDR
jgi:uncharacterized protein (TIGR02145 family)